MAVRAFHAFSTLALSALPASSGSRAEAQLLSLGAQLPPAIQEIALVVALDHEVVVTAAQPPEERGELEQLVHVDPAIPKQA